MKIRMLWGFCWVALSWQISSQGWAYPTSQRRDQTPTSRPVRSVVAPAVQLRVDHQGQLWIGQQSVSIPALIANMVTWKQQATLVQMVISPQTPMSRVLVVQTLLREYQIQWQMAQTAASSGPALSGTPPGASPTSKVSRTRTQHGTFKTSGVVHLSPWHKVPMKMQQGIVAKTTGIVELRGLLWSAGRVWQQTLPTALIRYLGKQRQALGHLQTNRAGQFRYRWQSQPGAEYRISVVSGQRIMEFPVPLDKQQQGYLYLRVSLVGMTSPPTVAKTATKAHSNMAVAPRKSQGNSVGPERRLVPTPPAPRPVQEGDRSERLGPCLWKQVPLGKMEKVSAKEGVEIRVRFLFPATMKQESLPTGLIQRKGKERTPVARVRTDGVGCARYWVKADAAVVYEVALLLGAKLSLLALPAVRPGSPTVTTTLAVKAQSAASTVIENLSVIYELVSSDKIRAVHVVQLFYQPAPMHQKDEVILPLAAGAQQIKLEQGIPGASWKAEKIGLRLTNTPKAGSYRVLYHYELPREQGATSWHLVSAQQVAQVNLFFGKGLKPGFQAKLQSVQLGKDLDKRNFQVLRLPGMQKGQALKVPVLGIEPPQRGLLAWIRQMKNEPNGKNKLIGLAVLFSISLLGLFWIFSSPNIKKNTPNLA